MSAPPVYSFFPWLRQGLGNRIAEDDLDTGVPLRATITVGLELTGTGKAAPITQPITRPIPLAGPGDIVGIESKAIIRTEPRNWITNFEPNYVPFIEFYDEDFPWRYTPAKGDTQKHRLRPWIALIVLKEGEFADAAKLDDKALPCVNVVDPAAFPPAEQLWAWAHVHVNRGMIPTGIRSTVIDPAVQNLQTTLDENADLAYSRLVCPRKLEANAAYHAFLMPVFESGRLAGLGMDPAKAPNATASAWGGYATREEGTKYPYYHRWFFRTGTIGDFEYLVRLLQPRTVDKRVGTRDIDVQEPGANLPGLADPALEGVLKLGGALRVPRDTLLPEDRTVVERYERWAEPYPRPFQTALASLVSLADAYTAAPAVDANAATGLDEVRTDPDPLITPPLYGQWHALVRRLLKERDGRDSSPNDNWVHNLNLDPRHRVAAGFGTRVVQDRQEDYMNAAWQQVGDVLEAQRRIRAAQLAAQTAWVWHEHHLKPLHSVNPERAFMLSAPVHGRVLGSDTTVLHQVRRSALPPSTLSAPVRRAMRPGGRTMRTLEFTGAARPDRLLRRINSGEVSPAPPRIRPAGILSPADVSRHLLPSALPNFLASWLRGVPALPLLVLLFALVVALLLLFFLSAGVVAAGVALAIGVALFVLLRSWAAGVRRADTINDEIATPADVASMPRSPDFTITAPGQGITSSAGATDSAEAVRFKEGIRNTRRMIAASRKAADAAAAAEGPHLPLNFSRITQAVLAGIDPTVTIPRRTLKGIHLPERLKPLVVEKFLDPFAYPEFDTPMYKPLADLSAELFLPNLNLIEQNSVSVLETNQAFIEAYMVGLNHEFARELLWREYPTDQRGSYFRQFWDVSAYLPPQEAGAEALKESLRDIPPLHRWSRGSKLGDHDHRESGGQSEEEAVLVIRGELLKKYPNAVIYAHRARWQQLQGGGIDNTKERQLEPIAADEEEHPPRTKVKTPLYEAKVDPDVYFFGFDLTTAAARGGSGENQNDDPGWFFVIKERPGEPRFGLDVTQGDEIHVWNDLSWDDVAPGAAPGEYIAIDGTMAAFDVVAPTAPEDQEKQVQHADDVSISWNKDMTAADVAYVLYQAPVMVAIHAAEMLRQR